MERLARAAAFAAEKHTGQLRKGEAGEPYVNHVIEVAEMLARACGGRDIELVIGGLLHDTIEDTGATHAEVAAIFGPGVADLVAEVTDDKSLPKAERKRLQALHAPHKSPRAKQLKLADKTSNLRALASSPPAEWPLSRQLEYVAWARSVAAGLRGANAWLEEQFDQAATAAEQAIAGRR
ncbi:MAG: bifunctional (p)ppGpp synthetase/guanosine-3',5'-bis(diphosphate) 3'-pyrophosphohydrolase [Alphaproteobacteria bacterium]|nr:bifunctional (p)ppGpp synthetase/guanosine-3',5'-bis(diphosphate) 3'-pyrophosphohydrolase [Alphaproteobacteria bacterium]